MEGLKNQPLVSSIELVDLLSKKKSKTDQPVSESQFADHYYTKKFLDDYFKKLNLK